MTAPLPFRSTRYSPSHGSPSQDNHAPGSIQMSHAKVFDPRLFRARFAHYWSEFIRANYRSREEVAVNFGVTFQTASNWWDGANKPYGDSVALAGERFQEFMRGRA